MSSQLKVNSISDAAGANGNAITLATDGTCTAKVTNNLSNRNLIINGSMQIAQRGTSSTSNGYQTVDRFCHYSGGGTTTWSVGTETSGTVWGLGLRKYLRCTNTANATAAGNYREITYKIENRDLMDSGWNVASTSSKLTLSFWVRASVAQVYYGRIRWMGDSADSNFVFSTGSLTADTWTKVTVSIPGKAGKTVNDGGSQPDNTSLFQLNWSPFQGTDGTASGVALNQWNTYSGSDKYPDFATTWGSTNGATFDLTGVQLELSDYASDFENRTYGDEYNRCLRYFWLIANGSESAAGSGGSGLAPVATGNCFTSSLAFAVVPFPTRMRAAPSIYKVTSTDYWDVVTNDGNTQADDVTINRASTTSVSLYFSGNLSINTTYGCHIRTYNSAARLGVQAEL